VERGDGRRKSWLLVEEIDPFANHFPGERVKSGLDFDGAGAHSHADGTGQTGGLEHPTAQILSF
jgi:hypothetical protein